MPFALPYSRQRRYLTGVDWIIGTLNAMTRRNTSAGNSSQIILELEGRVDAGALFDAVTRFAAHFPALSGRVARDCINLAPFWKMDRPEGRCLVRLLPEQGAAADAIGGLCREINVPFATDRDHLAIHLVHAGPARSFLGMVFDHRLFDARGAELFLDRFAAFAAGQPPAVPPEIAHPAREPYLAHWATQFRAGRALDRALIQCAAVRPALFPLTGLPGARSFRYCFQTLDKPESLALTEAAYAAGGYLVKLPYLLALAIEAVDRVFASRGLAPERYVIPVSIDRRAAGADNQTLFFNHVSFIHFLIGREQMSSRETLVQTILLQMYEQTKARLQEDFEHGSMLMRILPVGALAALAERLFGGNFGSFIFSSLGESACRARRLLGHPIVNLLHTPRVSTPPGVGLFVNEFDGRTNVTAATVEDALTQEEAASLVRHFKPPAV